MGKTKGNTIDLKEREKIKQIDAKNLKLFSNI